MSEDEQEERIVDAFRALTDALVAAGHDRVKVAEELLSAMARIDPVNYIKWYSDKINDLEEKYRE